MLEREPLNEIRTFNAIVSRVAKILEAHDVPLLQPVTPRIVKESKYLRFHIEANETFSVYLDDVAIARRLPTNKVLSEFKTGPSNAIRNLLYSLCAGLQTTIQYRQYVEKVVEHGIWDGLYEKELRKHAEYRYKTITLTRESNNEISFTIKGDNASHVSGLIFNTILVGA